MPELHYTWLPYDDEPNSECRFGTYSDREGRRAWILFVNHEWRLWINRGSGPEFHYLPDACCDSAALEDADLLLQERELLGCGEDVPLEWFRDE